jgi:hypothetical protein
MSDELTLGRGTTPQYVISIDSDVDTSNIKDAYVTFTQARGESLTKHFPEVYIDNNNIVVLLTQEETLLFKVGTAQMQLRFVTFDDRAYKSDIFKLLVTPVLYEEVI